MEISKLAINKKITAFFADGSQKMNLGIATVIGLLHGKERVPVDAKEGYHQGSVRVSLPPKGMPRDRWLTRSEAAGARARRNALFQRSNIRYATSHGLS